MLLIDKTQPNAITVNEKSLYNTSLYSAGSTFYPVVAKMMNFRLFLLLIGKYHLHFIYLIESYPRKFSFSIAYPFLGPTLIM